MLRHFAWPVLLLSLAGCRSAGQTFENPFQTRIPPPGTAVPGTLPATAGAYDPNANVAPLFTPNNSAAAAAPAAVVPPAASAPAAAPAGAAPQYAPPGGFDFRASQVTPVAVPPVTVSRPGATIYRPTGAVSSPSESRWGHGSTSSEMSPPDGFAQSSSPGGSVAQASAHTAEPGGVARASHWEAEPQSGAAVRGARTTGASPRQGEAIDIMDLPPAGSRSAADRVRPTVERTSYRYADQTRHDSPAEQSAPDELGEQPARAPDSPAAAGQVDPQRRQSTSYASYGHDPNYAWLKGQLEYSHIDRRWKLRYTPIDGQTDKHGGSVVLPDSSLLESFEPGDFIAVQGRLSGKASSGYAPLYELSRVKRLDP